MDIMPNNTDIPSPEERHKFDIQRKLEILERKLKRKKLDAAKSKTDK